PRRTRTTSSSCLNCPAATTASTPSSPTPTTTTTRPAPPSASRSRRWCASMTRSACIPRSGRSIASSRQGNSPLCRASDIPTRTGGRNHLGFDCGPDGPYGQEWLVQRLQLVARLVQQGFGTRVFYAMFDGFDTHSGQAEEHRKLLQQLADAIRNMYATLQGTG